MTDEPLTIPLAASQDKVEPHEHMTNALSGALGLLVARVRQVELDLVELSREIPGDDKVREKTGTAEAEVLAGGLVALREILETIDRQVAGPIKSLVHARRPRLRRV